MGNSRTGRNDSWRATIRWQTLEDNERLLLALLLLGMLIEICSAQSRKHYKLDVKMKNHVCFFVYVASNRHWFNRVPETNLGIACLPSALTLTLAVPTYP